jgi:hypothetical protein
VKIERQDAMDGRCLFCHGPLSEAPGERNVEHIVPQSLGGSGWLATRLVCRACNSRLGREVDRVADVSLLVALRAEAGLPTRRALEGSYFDPDI